MGRWDQPASLRRAGRIAYYRGGEPAEINPYKKGGRGHEFRARDWLDGWNEAKAADEREIEAQLARQEDE